MASWWVEATEHEGLSVYEDDDDQVGPAGPYPSERDAWRDALEILINRRDHLRESIRIARREVRRTARKTLQ